MSGWDNTLAPVEQIWGRKHPVKPTLVRDERVTELENLCAEMQIAMDLEGADNKPVNKGREYGMSHLHTFPCFISLMAICFCFKWKLF